MPFQESLIAQTLVRGTRQHELMLMAHRCQDCTCAPALGMLMAASALAQVWKPPGCPSLSFSSADGPSVKV